ncbi:OmpA family protein [Erwinia sp. 9145]|uniref:OmpA family protein n=1 Tax=Erwinia sp. 9145 TaxID=1500895 RepID=UPI00068EAA32|nr:OmpA family protein [Erwinia sp. 9145]
MRSAPFVTTTKLIVSSVTQDERKEIVAHLNGESIFSESRFAPITNAGGKGAAMIGDAAKPEPEKLEEVISRSDRELETLSNTINDITAANHAQGNLSLEKVPQGLRILLKDDSNRMMFTRGSVTMTPFFQRLLSELAPVFNRLDNQIMITGHTDAAHYRDAKNYNNWNLSGDRALAARRVLEKGGIQQDRIMQVNAMADRMLLDPNDPYAASNRRIEIMVLTKAAADTLYQFYGPHGVNVVKPIADRLQ